MVTIQKRKQSYKLRPYQVLSMLLVASVMVIIHVHNLLGSTITEGLQPSSRQITTTTPNNNDERENWCDRVSAARSKLNNSFLGITYPCKDLKPATSAIVTMLTAGVDDPSKATKIVFTAQDYLEGAMALGYSVKRQIDPTTTHMLLLLREGFVLSPDDLVRLKSVGWIIGTAPNFPLKKEYLPRFPRYKTTYTKVSAIGLSEYKCVMLMDADALAIGDLRELLTCDAFTKPQQRVGGTLDLYQRRWYFFNTGSILWRTSAEEMDRVYELSRNGKFMRRYSSDQEFLNHVYPDRLNRTNNERMINGDMSNAYDGAVVPLSWDYNAQTHVEVEGTDYWVKHRPTVKVLHYTQKKGWQCKERHTEPPPIEEMPKPCKKEIDICFCREAHLYWDALNKAKGLANMALQSEKSLLASSR